MTEKTGKNSFAPDELTGIYDQLAPIIQSKYGAEALSKGKIMMRDFVKKGGTIEILS